MNVLLLGKASVASNAVLTEFLRMGSARGHRVQGVDKQTLLDGELTTVDVVCLKSHFDSDRVWRKLQSSAVRAVNSRASCELCADRARLDLLLRREGVALPRGGSLPQDVRALTYPVVCKPRRGDGDIQVLARAPASIDGETFFYQERVPHDGWVYKVYCIGATVTLRLERSDARCAAGAFPEPDAAAAANALMPIVHRVRAITGLDVFGLDFVESIAASREGGAYLLIDVNPFPSFRGVPRAAEQLWVYLESFGEAALHG